MFDKLKKLFGSGGVAPPQSAAPADPKDRRASERFRLAGDASGVEVIINSAGGEERASVFDMSRAGLCFETDAPESALGAQKILDAHVRLMGEDVPVSLRVVNRRGRMVGCQVADMAPAWLEAVSRFLNPLRLGQSLHEINPRLVQQRDPNKTMRWFQGSPGCDLFTWTNDADQLVKAQLFFSWKAVEWSVDTGLRTGQVQSPPVDKPDRGYPSSHLYDLKTPADQDTMDTAQRLLEASLVPEGIKKLFISRS